MSFPGRASQKSPVRIYQTLAPKGSKWYVHGYVAMAGNYLLMMFYTVVAGWMIQYFFATASGRFNGLDTQQVEEVYHQICANPVGMVGFTALVVVLGFFICSFSLQKGGGAGQQIHDAGTAGHHGDPGHQ